MQRCLAREGLRLVVLSFDGREFGDLVVADTGNSRGVTVRGALPAHARLRLPVLVRGSVR